MVEQTTLAMMTPAKSDVLLPAEDILSLVQASLTNSHHNSNDPASQKEDYRSSTKKKKKKKQKASVSQQSDIVKNRHPHQRAISDGMTTVSTTTTSLSNTRSVTIVAPGAHWVPGVHASSQHYH
jgi:hypothetical protein